MRCAKKFIQDIHNFAQTLIGGVIRKQNISDEDITIQPRAPPTGEEHHATRPEIKTCTTRIVRNYAEAIQFLKDFEKLDEGAKNIWSRLLNRTCEITHASLNDELLEARNLKKRLIAPGLLGADAQRNVEGSIAQLERQKPKPRNISAIDHKIAEMRGVLEWNRPKLLAWIQQCEHGHILGPSMDTFVNPEKPARAGIIQQMGRAEVPAPEGLERDTSTQRMISADECIQESRQEAEGLCTQRPATFITEARQEHAKTPTTQGAGWAASSENRNSTSNAKGMQSIRAIEQAFNLFEPLGTNTL